MILKIKTANHMTDNSWRFFEGVTNLHYNIYDAGIFCQEVKSSMSAEVRVEGVQYVEFWDALPPDKAVHMTFDSELTGPIEITCNTTVYLMNDQGKTIERLI